MIWRGTIRAGGVVDCYDGGGSDPTYHHLVAFKAPENGAPGYAVIHAKGGRWSNNGGQHYTPAYMDVYQVSKADEHSFETCGRLIGWDVTWRREGE